jgi:hypothetical protein
MRVAHKIYMVDDVTSGSKRVLFREHPSSLQVLKFCMDFMEAQMYVEKGFLKMR